MDVWDSATGEALLIKGESNYESKIDRIWLQIRSWSRQIENNIHVVTLFCLLIFHVSKLVFHVAPLSHIKLNDACGENTVGKKSSKEVGFELRICNHGNNIEKADEERNWKADELRFLKVFYFQKKRYMKQSKRWHEVEEELLNIGSRL